MDTSDEKDEVYFSFNAKIINKNERKDTFALANGWEFAGVSIDYLIRAIQAGFAYSACYKHGIRKTANFLGTNLASIDIDGTNTIDEAIAQEFSQKYLTAFYTTCSHNSEEQRFRLIFKLERIIDSPVEFKNILRALQLKYSGDPAATDATRIFFGNSSAFTQVWDRQIPNDVIDELIKLNVQPEWDSQKHDGGLATNVAKLKLAVDTLITTSDGRTLKFVEIPNRTPVFCPHHLDKNASAFIGVKPNGLRYLHCMTCQNSWHQVNPLYESESTIKLDFVETMRSVKDMSIEDMKAQLTKLPTQVDGIDLHNANITFTKNKYLSLDSIKPGLTLIKSPKGSGKTQSLAGIIKKAFYRHHAITLDEFELNSDDDGPPPSWETGKRVLLIGHRQALIRSMCQRLNLNCYLDEKDLDINPNMRDFRKRYGVCLDSIKRVSTWNNFGKPYELVIIDEVEQVLAHLLANTSRDAGGYLDVLYDVVNKAESVIAMDADLDWTSFLTLNSMRNSNPAHGVIYRNEICINEYVEEDKEFEIYDSKSELVAKLMNEVEEGKKVFVSTNSKKQVDRMHLVFQHDFPEKRVMAITSENSNNKNVIEFISDIKNECRKYDVVISSPSLGTGVDITFSDDEQFYDSVYGFYEALVNSHTEIDQQLSRVRHPKSVKVWISPRRFNFETNFDVIKADLICSNAIANTATDQRLSAIDKVFVDDNRLLRTAALILSTQRESKNNLKNNFIEHKVAQGWAPKLMPSKDDIKLGSDFIRLGKELEEKQYEDRLLQSTPIDHNEFNRIDSILQDDDGERISSSEFHSLQRMKMEIFYCRQIDASMITLDDRWALRKQYRAYKKFIEYEFIGKFASSSRGIPIGQIKKRLSIRPDDDSVLYLLYGLLSTTQFFVNKKFDLTIEFCNDDLTVFAKTCIKLKSVIETQMRIAVRSDVLHKANSQLGQLLKIIGLKTIKTRAAKINGTKIYFYKLDESSLTLMNDLLLLEDQRQNQWGLINARYGFN